VPRLGPKAFEQCAGFLRIRGGDDPLDASGVHPEAYPVVRRILAATGSEAGVLIGGTAGFNYQIGSWVLGVEGDGDWANLNGTTFNASCAPVGCTTQSSWLATVRGRAGYAWDRLLVYGTGGPGIGMSAADACAAAASKNAPAMKMRFIRVAPRICRRPSRRG